MPSWTAAAVPARTGDTDAASVAGRAASHQTRAGLGPPGEAGEVRPALLDVRVTALLRLLAQVVQQRRVAGELLDAGQAVVGGVHAGLEHAQRQGAVLEHPARPGDGLLLEAVEWHDPVDQAHLQRLARVVLLAQEPDLPRLLLAHDARQQAGAAAA